MKIEFPVPFRCPANLAPHLEKVFSGEYEIPLYGPQIILDIGANVGAFSVWAAHRFPGSEIHAYEPNPDCFEFFERNVEHVPGVTLYKHGIGTPGWRVLMNGEHNLGEASLFAGGSRGTTGKHVEIRSPQELPEATILKMDVEGAELEILSVIAGRKFAAVLLEYHCEELRRECDALLGDYILIGSDVAEPGRGTLRYIRKGLK